MLSNPALIRKQMLYTPPVKKIQLQCYQTNLWIEYKCYTHCLWKKIQMQCYQTGYCIEYKPIKYKWNTIKPNGVWFSF